VNESDECLLLSYFKSCLHYYQNIWGYNAIDRITLLVGWAEWENTFVFRWRVTNASTKCISSTIVLGLYYKTPSWLNGSISSSELGVD